MRGVGVLLLLLFVAPWWGAVLGGPSPSPPRCPGACRCHGDLRHVICASAGLRRIPRVSDGTLLLDLQRNPRLGGGGAAVAPGAFGGGRALESLHLQHCGLKEIQANAFRGLGKLVYLYLSHNLLSSLHRDAFRDLGALTYLHLDGNRLGALAPGLFSPMPNLFVLQLDANRLKELQPGTFSGAKDLRRLHLSRNQLAALRSGALDEVENLALVHLDYNRLSVFPADALSRLRVVEELNMAGNPMRNIPDLAFQSFGRYVETIRLDHMELDKLSDGAFTGVSALKSLHLDNNRLKLLPPSLDLTSISNLTLANNPWMCSCQLLPLRRWMEFSGNRPEAVCSSPTAQRGKLVGETPAFNTCKTRKNRRGERP